MFALAALVTALAVGGPPAPHIVQRPIPFAAARKAETARYAERHYGLDTLAARAPPRDRRALHGDDDRSRPRWNTFAADTPDAELGELPGTCAHFVIDRDGTIYQLVPLDTICRHTVGLNWTAIGIEHVGTSDASILDDPRQLDASLALTLWLMHAIRHLAAERDRARREPHEPLPPRALRTLALPDARRLAARRHGRLPRRLAALARSEHVVVSRAGGAGSSAC